MVAFIVKRSIQMRYLTVLCAAAAVFLTACQPPEPDDDKEDTLAHPPIQESQSGKSIGPDKPDDLADISEEPAAGAERSAQQPAKAVTGENAAAYVNKAFRVQVVYPESMRKLTGEAAGGWHEYTAGPWDGQELLTLKVPGEVDARFQLGASRSIKALSHCKDLPEGAEDSRQTWTIDGVPFVRFDLTRVDGDTYTMIRGYRATYTEACYAIDLVASGTGGEGDVADRQTRAMKKLQTVLDGVRFTE